MVVERQRRLVVKGGGHCQRSLRKFQQKLHVALPGAI